MAFGAEEKAGLQMAVLTTLVRILEVKWREMEGPHGTGTLEEDVRLLQVPTFSFGEIPALFPKY